MEEKATQELREEILNLLPYKEPFLFVDSIDELSDAGAEGRYTFRKDLTFYEGHFPGFPLTPGVLLTECMAQIGMVALGIYLLRKQGDSGEVRFAFTQADVKFLAMVPPGSTVTVKSEKKLFRMGVLRAETKIYLEDGTLAAEGKLSGFRIKDE